MFYMDAQNVIAKSDNRHEIQEGTVSIGPSPSDKTKKNKHRKHNH